MAALLALAVALLALALPASAHAQDAELTLSVAPRDGVALGQAHTLRGRLSRNGRSLAGEVVELEAHRFPYRRGFTRLRRLTTDRRGRFMLRRRLDRNHLVRAVAPEAGARSGQVTALTFPRVRVEVVAGEDEVELIQRYRTPADVRLTPRTRFYLAPSGARTAPLRAQVATRRTGPGRFEARATIPLPAQYEGRFRYASCFPYDPRAGMGDPGTRCPRRAFTF